MEWGSTNYAGCYKSLQERNFTPKKYAKDTKYGDTKYMVDRFVEIIRWAKVK